jgi:hypothetical protein
MDRSGPDKTDHFHQKSVWFCHGDVIPEGLALKDVNLTKGRTRCIADARFNYARPDGIDIKGVRVIPVAAPGHPLAQANGVAPPQARDFVQLVLSEQPAAESSRDFGVVSLNTWRIGDQPARHRLLLAGLGWGGMPEPIVRADIESGRLVRLNLPDWRGGEHNLQAIHKIDTPPGPAGRWLIERLVTLSDEGEAPIREMTKPIKRKGRRRPQGRVSARKRSR